VLALAGLAFGRAQPAPRRRMLWFWMGTLAVATRWALGGFTPFYRIVYAVVPGTEFFRAPSTMLFLVSFCIAVLAAFGTERALGRRDDRLGYLLAWLAVGLVVALLATSGALTSLATTLAPEPRLDRVDASAGRLTLGAWRSLVALGAVAAVLFAYWRGSLSARVAGWALAVIVVADLWSVERLYWRFSPPAAEIYRTDPAIEYVKRSPQPGRVIPWAVELERVTSRDPVLGWGDGKGTGLMIHRVRNVMGYHGNELGRYQLLTGADIDPSWVQRFLSPNLRRLTNARFWYTNSAEPPLPEMRRVAGPATNAAGNIVYLYEFAEDNPPAWVAPVAIKAPDENVLATVLDPRFDVSRAALFDTSATVPVQASPPSTLPPPSDVRVRVTRWEPGLIDLTLDRPAADGSTLLVSENYYPGWQATVDGRPAPIGRAQFVLIGVGLPPGARTIQLRFRSPVYERGRAITVAALGAASLLLLGGLIIGRTRRG
jgi:hypothetical protein